ncbi:uncharacterized protein JCM10292_007592 [Rhodotorula paludigena]|uniref:uncharacterized protein n=1 Tax=Rhodotorula paludigena TaxID=86838 RepID=UPI003177B833
MPPKRPATTFTADHSTDRAAAALAGKRVKFAPNNAERVAADRDADDLELDLEQGGAGPNKKRNKVTTEGYDSDSSADSDGGFGGAGGGRKGRGVGQQAAEPERDEEEDEDMFGGPSTAKDSGLATKGKKKEKEFLEIGDIEGQEFGRADMADSDDGDGPAGDDADEESEEDYLPEDDEANNDEAPRGRRSKKGMGYSLSSFNMKEELAEGRFTADGTYTANTADPLATHDVWLDGLSKRSIRAAREAKERADARQRQREADEARSDEQLTQLRDDCMIGLVQLVRPGETVAKALNRLGAAKKRAEADEAARKDEGQGQGKGKRRSDGMDLDEGDTALPSASSSPALASQRYAAKIDRLTHFASTLLSAHGELEIYDQQHADLVQTLKSEGAVRRDWVPPVDPDVEREEREAAEHARREKEARDRERAEHRSASGGGGRSKVVIARPGAAGGGGGAAGTSSAGPRFFYKWNEPPPGQPEGQEYGPYDRAALEGWVQGGYFGDGAGRISVRREDEQGRWTKWSEVR